MRNGNHIKRRVIVFSLLVFFALIYSPAPGKEDSELGVDAALFSGVSLVDIEGSSYRLKAMPTAGISLFPYLHTGSLVGFGAELSLQYTLKSSYSNFYYYNAHGSVTLVPGVSLRLRGRRFTYFFNSGLGGAYLFSDYLDRGFLVVSFGTGIHLEKGFIKGIFLSYNHNFISTFQAFETVKAYCSIHLWDNMRRSSFEKSR